VVCTAGRAADLQTAQFSFVMQWIESLAEIEDRVAERLDSDPWERLRVIRAAIALLWVYLLFSSASVVPLLERFRPARQRQPQSVPFYPCLTEITRIERDDEDREYERDYHDKKRFFIPTVFVCARRELT
jgi:hypothetical protein